MIHDMSKHHGTEHPYTCPHDHHATCCLALQQTPFPVLAYKMLFLVHIFSIRISEMNFPHRKKIHDWVVVSNIFCFHPYLGKMNPFWRAYFPNWVGLKPPSRWSMVAIFLPSQLKFDLHPRYHQLPAPGSGPNSGTGWVVVEARKFQRSWRDNSIGWEADQTGPNGWWSCVFGWWMLMVEVALTCFL